jgi:hypothetical protein
MKDIEVDGKVIEYIKKNKGDFRVSTSCYGPVIVPIQVKPPKDTDIRIKVGDYMLFVSIVQARYISRVTMDMIYDPDKECSVF